MLNSKLVKEIVKDLGVEVCGVAPADRFSKAPRGFRPNDIYKDCKTVVVFAKRLPTASMLASNCVPYTFMKDVMTHVVDRITLEVSMKLEDLGVSPVPIPSDDPYEHWEADRSYGRAILSLRHAGCFAGLGVLGKNTLLINNEFGNMVHLGAVLIDVDLEGDPIAAYEGCLDDCELCITSCPNGALDGKTVNQQLCRPLSTFRTPKGYVLNKCNICRKVCPSALGIRS